MSNPPPNPKPLWEFVRPVLGLAAWGVKQGHGSFLTFEFGEPTLEIRERRPDREGLRRSTSVHGYWHLWIYCCNWRILQNEKQLAWSEDDRSVIEFATFRLDGQKLFSSEVDAKSGRSTFRFDLGGELKTWPYGDDHTEEQWMLFAGKEVFTYRADGSYKKGPSDTPDDSVLWLPLP